ncbi:TetR/AcrR family transcriptional regulator [Phytoactinopolyspora limicola]|uniref:TetR/AcrR family transcriptional regulator n=1 Tax=Phytoactinopolyspora limicola TaxID=2715536 RepID=UPI001FE6C43F|nr:TetR/AcrR family transcriptional regulator [Phytoactinopolyspora limicola]
MGYSTVMGHREALLEGAKRCLYEKGYARTTARDIVAASGTNLASIGYHFGSKEALLNAALTEAVTEMGQELLQATSKDMTGPSIEDLSRGWSNAINRLNDFRPLLIAQLEAWAQIERSPELRSELAALYRAQTENGLEHAKAVAPWLDDRSARAAVVLTNAIADGLMVQWLLDPDNGPTGEDVALGLAALTSVVTDDDTTPRRPRADSE